MLDEVTNSTTKAGYARKVGKSRQAIHKAVNDGRVIVNADGTVDEEASDKQLGTLADAKRREALARAEVAEAKARVMLSKLVDKAAVAAEVAALARAERDALMLLPARDAPAMAAALGVDEARLRLAIEDMLRGFLERPLPALK